MAYGSFPWATFAVNVLGCLLIGLFTGIAAGHLPAQWKLVLVTGFCGGFTTFSTFMNKNNYTLKAIKESRRFSLSIIAEDTDPSIIGTFGFQSSRDADKYANYGFRIFGEAPCVNGKFAGRLILDAINFVDNETHIVVLARLVDTVKGDGEILIKCPECIMKGYYKNKTATDEVRATPCGGIS